MPRYSGTFRIKGIWLPFNRIFDPALASHYFITEQFFDGLVKFDAHLQSHARLGRILGDLRRRIAHHLQAPPGRPLPQRPRAHGRGRQILAREAGPEPAGQHLLPVFHPQGRRGRGLSGRAWPTRSPDSGSSIRPPSRSSGPGPSARSASTSWACTIARSCPRTSSRARAGTSSTSPSGRAPSSSPNGSAAPAWTSWASGSSGTAPFTESTSPTSPPSNTARISRRTSSRRGASIWSR